MRSPCPTSERKRPRLIAQASSAKRTNQKTHRKKTAQPVQSAKNQSIGSIDGIRSQVAPSIRLAKSPTPASSQCLDSVLLYAPENRHYQQSIEVKGEPRTHTKLRDARLRNQAPTLSAMIRDFSVSVNNSELLTRSEKVRQDRNGRVLGTLPIKVAPDVEPRSVINKSGSHFAADLQDVLHGKGLLPIEACTTIDSAKLRISPDPVTVNSSDDHSDDIDAQVDQYRNSLPAHHVKLTKCVMIGSLTRYRRICMTQ